MRIWLMKSLWAGLQAPSPPSPFPRLHISSFGVIPKKGQPGKWRLIVDLSSPGGASVNDGIDPQDFSLQYIKVDQVIRMVSRYGHDAWTPLTKWPVFQRTNCLHYENFFILGCPVAGAESGNWNP